MSDEDFSIESELAKDDEKNKRKLEREKRKIELSRENYLLSLKAILETEGGRNVIWNFLEKSKMFQDPFCGENTNNSAYYMGMQSVGRSMLADILEAEPGAYIEMQKEKMNAENLKGEKND